MCLQASGWSKYISTIIAKNYHEQDLALLPPTEAS